MPLQGVVDDTVLVAWHVHFKPQVFAKWLIHIARRRERMSADSVGLIFSWALDRLCAG